MKSCSPRHWPEWRFIMGVVLVMALFIALTLLTQSLVIGAVTVALAITLDFIAFRQQRRLPHWHELDAYIWLDQRALGQVVLVGTPFLLHASVSCKEKIPTVMIAPLLPAFLRSTAPAGRIVRSGEATSEFTWHVEAQQVGPAVIPGLLIMKLSPLGLFRTITMGPARLALYAADSPEEFTELAQVLKRNVTTSEDRRSFVRGGGTDFRELRQYQQLDPLSRIDWKATARHGELIVREMEEPRDFTISVVLDASCDLTYGPDGAGSWFERTLLFLGRLADVATRARIRLAVTLYDEHFQHRICLSARSSGIERFLADLAQLPRAAVLRRSGRDPRLRAPLHQLARKQLRAWSIDPSDRVAFVSAYVPELADSENQFDAMLADTDPAAVIALDDRCARCGTRVFPDEVSCRRCEVPLGDGELPLRASAACNAIADVLQRAQGRQMLLFVSSLSGGETTSGVADALANAQAQYRVVHVIAPSSRELLAARPEWPGSLGHGPVWRELLRDMDRLSRAAEFVAFERHLRGAGIALHAIDDRESLHELIRAICHNAHA